jgi:hypothetical protein
MFNFTPFSAALCEVKPTLAGDDDKMAKLIAD